jgi:NitT/TauT family transport system ATP-binding protein
MSAIAIDRPAPDIPGRHNDVHLRNAGKSYADRGRVVRGLAPISLDIAGGSLVAIVGRSGCGKSTLLRLIAGLIDPTAGSIEIGAAALSGPPDQARYVFQDYGQSLLPWKTVMQNVEFGVRHGFRNQAHAHGSTPSESLALVGLAGTGDRYPWELSGGMQQRVAVARAISAQPSVLLLDEPFSSVDALSRAQLQDMILNVWGAIDVTVVLVTHDIDEAIYLADRVIVLEPEGAGIGADITIDLPRPRHQIETREQTNYLAYRRDLFHLVTGE